MSYDEALDAYTAARDELAQWGDGYSPAAQVTDAENRMVHAALELAAAVAEREGR